MSQHPSDKEQIPQTEHHSPVAVRKLRSGRKIKTPSSHSKRRREDDDDDDDYSMSDASSHGYRRTMNKEDTNANNNNNEDVIMHDSSDDGKNARSVIKVNRRLIHTLDVLMEQEPHEEEEEEEDNEDNNSNNNSNNIIINNSNNNQDKANDSQQKRGLKTSKRSKRKISDVGPNQNHESQDEQTLPQNQQKSHSKRKKPNTTDPTNHNESSSMDVEPTSVQQDSTHLLDREEQIQQILENAIRLDNTDEPTVVASPMITTRAPSHRPPTVPRSRRGRKSSSSSSSSSSGSRVRHDGEEVVEVPNRRRTTSPAPSNSDVDSEVEHLHLQMPKREEVEMEEEEREEGRRDGLFHKYFNIPSDTRDGRMVTKLLGLVFILHLSLTLLMMGNSDFRLGIPYWTFLSPFCIFVDLNGSARLAWLTYERWGLFEAPTNFTADIIQKERVEEDLIYETVIVENLELENEELELRKTRKQIEFFQREQNEMKIMHETMRMAIEQITGVTNMKDDTSEISDQQDSIRKKLLAYKEKLDSKMKEFSVLEKSNKADSISMESIFELDTFGFLSPSLRLMKFNDINIPGETCLDQKITLGESEDVEYVTKDDINAKLNEYMDAALETYQTIHNDYGDVSSPFIIDWMNEVIERFLRKYELSEDINLDNIVFPTIEESTESDSILTIRMIKELVAKRIEIERADRTGEHDYASLRSDAQIIRTGPRRTSPSLIETLPLMNQLLSALGLRFHGHGAYAALEPTYPADNMGQCWSFSKESEMTKIAPKLPTKEQDALDREPARGKYATLAVKLADAIWVESVVIEHPHNSDFSNRDTAIRKFRVYGFQDEAANGKAWFLGEFEYLSGSDEVNQVFDVETESEDGQDIPPMSSVVLAIDSNWGADYSCLYRFKVHGELANDE